MSIATSREVIDGSDDEKGEKVVYKEDILCWSDSVEVGQELVESGIDV